MQEENTQRPTNHDSLDVQDEFDSKGRKLHKLPVYSKGEEMMNVITHAIGTAIGIIAAIAMITLSIIDGNPSKIVGSVVFSFGLIWLYSMSTCYHNEKDLGKRRIRQKFDHLSINILIASSFTFFAVAALANKLGYILAAIVWALSILSMILNSINVKKYRAITMFIYILTGWMPIFISHILLGALSVSGFVTLLAGGLFYTVGVCIYGIHKPYMHGIWHVFVLGGSISHIICGIVYVIL